jgi:uncharacterized protein (TIGR03067 family)
MAAGLLLAAGDPQENAVRQELENLRGRWKLISWGEEPMPQEFQATLTFFLGDRYWIQLPDRDQGEGTYRIDPAFKPKTLDLTPGEGPHKWQTRRTVYELEGDTLRICFRDADSERPTELKTQRPEQVVLVFQRDKP